MDELREQLARLREDAALCEAMSSEATDPDHRQMLARLAARLLTMIEAVEAEIVKITGGPET
jgi:hypothetical protein